MKNLSLHYLFSISLNISSLLFLLDLGFLHGVPMNKSVGMTYERYMDDAQEKEKAHGQGGASN